MKPAYFPFSYIPEPVAAAIHEFFGGVVVYQPNDRCIPALARQLADAGKVEIRVPVTGDEDRLSAKLAEYHQWSNIHGKSAAMLAARPGKGTYPSDFSSNISSEILGESAQADEKADPLFSARLFLQTAQQFDQDQDDIDRKLAHAERSRKNLLSGLDGRPADASLDLPFPEEDAGALMTLSRLSAWCRLANEDAAMPLVLVTSSREVVRHIQEKFSEKLRTIDVLSSGAGGNLAEAVNKALLDLTQIPRDAKTLEFPAFSANVNENIQIQMLIIEDTSPDRFCRLFIDPAQHLPAPKGPSAHMVVFLFSIK